MAQFDIPPMNVEFGWGEFANLKDARLYARGVIEKRFTSYDASWYSVEPFHGGYFWEAHEGGAGKCFLKSAIKALEADPGGEHWFQVGDRAMMIVMQDGRPFPHLLPTSKSIPVFNSGVRPLSPGGRMTPFRTKGTGWLIAGAIMAGIGALLFLGSIGFYLAAYNPGPSVRAVDTPMMPHMQWSKVEDTDLEEIVEKLELVDGERWEVKRRAHVIEGLDRIRAMRAEIERANQVLIKAEAAAEAKKDEASRQAEQETPAASDGDDAAEDRPIPVGPPTAPDSGGN